MNCGVLAADLAKVFEALVLVGQSGAVPSPWPVALETSFNRSQPAMVPLNGLPAAVYTTASRPPSVRPAATVTWTASRLSWQPPPAASPSKSWSAATAKNNNNNNNKKQTN
jgi:hypothetical protein